ncbi:MAG: hypothetical protein IJC46_03040 [Clostridia bacterium]|nr:hypothetical protein [Clostridia bacterium]
MGCLFETLFEVIFEGIFEGIFDLIMFCYLKLMRLIVPDREVSEQAREKIKDIVTTVSVILFLIMFIGIFFLLPDEPTFNTVGKFMTYIPLGIIVVQILLGIIVKLIGIIKRK